MVRSFAVIIRSIVFNVLFYANMIGHMVVALPGVALPYPYMHAILRSYARTSLALLRIVCGIRVEWRGLEKIPSGACLIACKHQSVWETFALYTVLRDPTYVIKRELLSIPVFGWEARKSGMIAVDRSAGLAALTGMTARARQELARGRQIVVFPEGTRRAPGAEPDYKPGIYHLYGRTRSVTVPMALNSGLFWPRRSWRRLPGTIVVEVLEPIPPGLGREAFFSRMQGGLETASARLIEESRAHQDREIGSPLV